MSETQKRGKAGEDKTANFYRKRLFRIIGRNVRVGRAEIDIIARRGPLIVFAEVKSRQIGGMVRGSSALSPKQKKRLTRAAGAYLARMKNSAGIHCRFDLVEVGLDTEGRAKSLNHYPNAIRTDEDL